MRLALQRILSDSEAALFAHEVCVALKPGTWIFLLGDLGAGKTTFVSKMIRSPDAETNPLFSHSGQAEAVGPQSPTYSVVQNYPVPQHLADRFDDVVHMDLYRIQNPQELLYLGLDLLIAPRSLVIAEWPSRLSEQDWLRFWNESGVEVPKEVLKLTIGHVPNNPAVRSYCSELITQVG